MNVNKTYHKSEEQIDQEQKEILRAKEDRKFFAPIYKRYHRQIMKFVYQRTDDYEIAADLTQQIFLRAMMKLEKYEFRGLPFSSWLFRVAINELNQHFRKNSKHRTINVDDTMLHFMADEIEDTGELEDRKRKLPTVLKMLSADDFQYIELRFMENRPFKEIAEILDITENNAKVKTYRILKKLQNLITIAINIKEFK